MELRAVVATLESGEQDSVLKVLQVYNREVSEVPASPAVGFCATACPRLSPRSTSACVLLPGAWTGCCGFTCRWAIA